MPDRRQDAQGPPVVAASSLTANSRDRRPLVALEAATLVLVLLGALTGLAYGPVNPIANLVLQELSPPHLLGRAIGVLTSLAYASGPLGFLVVGPLIEWIGLRATFLALALVLVAVALASPFVRALRALDADPAAARLPQASVAP